MDYLNYLKINFFMNQLSLIEIIHLLKFSNLSKSSLVILKRVIAQSIILLAYYISHKNILYCIQNWENWRGKLKPVWKRMSYVSFVRTVFFKTITMGFQCVHFVKCSPHISVTSMNLIINLKIFKLSTQYNAVVKQVF